jgi:hypothetical protein
MKKRLDLSFLVVSIVFCLQLASCATLTEKHVAPIASPTDTPQATYTLYPTYTPYTPAPTNLPRATYTPYPTYTPFITPQAIVSYRIPEFPVTVFFPENYSLVKNDEQNRRGSVVSYDFIQTGEFLPSDAPGHWPSPRPYFDEIQFFTEASITNFVAYCATFESGEPPCFNGQYPDLDTYHGQKAAYQQGSDYEDYKLAKIGDRYYFTSYRQCRGSYCAIREYTTFVGDIKVDIWILMNPPQEPDESDLKLQIELSDRLFRSFYINSD